MADSMRAPSLTVKRARALRREMTLPEIGLWQALRGKRLEGLRIRRQHPIGKYILDFFCPSARVAIEIDGSSHQSPRQAEHDTRRDAWLQGNNIQVLRFSAADVLKDGRLAEVLEAIVQAVDAAGSSPAKRGRGTMRRMVEGAR